MVSLGKLNKLRITKKVDFGLYLDGEDYGEILLPKRYVSDSMEPGDELEVFIYLDGEERPIATTLKPLAQVGEFACLKVKSLEKAGAFMEWGIMKDVLVPFREQRTPMVAGRSYLVYLYVDSLTERILASQKLERFFSKIPPPYQSGDEVSALIWQSTDLGYKVVVENTWLGMLYKSDIFRAISPCEKLNLYVKKVRDDHKIDLILDKPGYGKVTDISVLILEKIKDNGGFLAITDKSEPETIYRQFGVSKKVFKQAIGQLYKERKIVIETGGIRIA